MKKIASLFSNDVRKALEKHMNIVLSDEHDYSDEELMNLYEKVTDNFPYEYSSDGEPLELGKIFEEFIDTFSINKLPI